MEKAASAGGDRRAGICCDIPDARVTGEQRNEWAMRTARRGALRGLEGGTCAMEYLTGSERFVIADNRSFGLDLSAANDERTRHEEIRIYRVKIYRSYTSSVLRPKECLFRDGKPVNEEI